MGVLQLSCSTLLFQHYFNIKSYIVILLHSTAQSMRAVMPDDNSKIGFVKNFSKYSILVKFEFEVAIPGRTALQCFTSFRTVKYNIWELLHSGMFKSKFKETINFKGGNKTTLFILYKNCRHFFNLMHFCEIPFFVMLTSSCNLCLAGIEYF